MAKCSYYNNWFFKQDSSYRDSCGIPLHDTDLEHTSWNKKNIYVHMFFFSLLCPGIPDLVLGILKILIILYFHDVLLQPAA